MIYESWSLFSKFFETSDELILAQIALNYEYIDGKIKGIISRNVRSWGRKDIYNVKICSILVN